MKSHITRAAAVALGAVALGMGVATVAAPAADAATVAQPAPKTIATNSLAPGETVSHLPGGVTVHTVPMVHRSAASHGVHPDGFGQNDGDCGTAKLWTYAASSQYQLSLIGNVPSLGLGEYEFNTNGQYQTPSIGAIVASGDTWSSGRVGANPGLFATAASVSGVVGDCSISVGAVWN